jgi:hypothetical protein
LRTKNRDELVQKINYATGAILAMIGAVLLFLVVVKYL